MPRPKLTEEEKKRRRLQARIKRLCEEYPDEVLKTLLDTPFWPEGISSGGGYTRYEDDTKGGNIVVMFSRDGDAWITGNLDPSEGMHSLRFRTYFGGGQSLRARAALIFLAVAIEMDNKSRPQRQQKGPKM